MEIICGYWSTLPYFRTMVVVLEHIHHCGILFLFVFTFISNCKNRGLPCGSITTTIQHKSGIQYTYRIHKNTYITQNNITEKQTNKTNKTKSAHKATLPRQVAGDRSVYFACAPRAMEHVCNSLINNRLIYFVTLK
jgi:hypothetical protein